MSKSSLLPVSLFTFFLLLVLTDSVFAQVSLRTQIEDIRGTIPADVGVSIIDLQRIAKISRVVYDHYTTH